jgi:hypothetical protein
MLTQNQISTYDYDRERMAKAGWFTAFAALQGVNLSVILFQVSQPSTSPL